jgi:actin beta/gamma 1
VILSGGNSLFKGMKERLQKEVSKLLDSKCKVIAPVERRLSTWIGGSILAIIS